MAEAKFYRLQQGAPEVINLNIGGFSGEASPLKTFGELIESMREHGMHGAADNLRESLLKGGMTEDWIQNQLMRFTPNGNPSIGEEVIDFTDIEFHMFPKGGSDAPL